MTTVFVISAPSGSGKSTLVRRLLDSDPRLLFSVSCTTRPRRGAEVPGRDYYYLSREEFETAMLEGQFLEHAEVFGNYYGTHRKVLDDAIAQGKDLVLDIDVQGASQLRRKIPDAVTIFILAPSRAVLEARLRARGEDSDAVIERRLKAAAKEIKNYGNYDYAIVNEEVESSVETLIAIVKAERVRRCRVEERIHPILATFRSKEL